MPSEDLEIPVPGGSEDAMPGENRFEAAEQTAVLGMTQGFAAANNRRIDGADALAEFVRLGHDARRDRMNQADSFAYRTAVESGAGRTRVESNTPASTQTVGGS